VPGTMTRPEGAVDGSGLRLATYRPLFSGPAVERVPELQFQRPEREVELAPVDAQRLGIANGQEVTVRSNGTSTTLRARLAEDLSAGLARIAEDHAQGLEGRVEVAP
jgi:anaerobic selenocysteine-containing dehydrogenase